jgi:quercetin dioxygenase-like cupin family protein
MTQLSIDAVTMENMMNALAASMVSVRCELPEVGHYFAKGMYLREFKMPAGMTVVGKKHKHQHFLLVTQGHAKVVSTHEEFEVRAGHISISEPSVKRCVHAFEDTTFITIHLNPEDTTDTDELEIMHIEECDVFAERLIGGSECHLQ